MTWKLTHDENAPGGFWLGDDRYNRAFIPNSELAEVRQLFEDTPLSPHEMAERGLCYRKCSECGPAWFDEDGCCVQCGEDTTLVPPCPAGAGKGTP